MRGSTFLKSLQSFFCTELEKRFGCFVVKATQSDTLCTATGIEASKNRMKAGVEQEKKTPEPVPGAEKPEEVLEALNSAAFSYEQTEAIWSVKSE